MTRDVQFVGRLSPIPPVVNAYTIFFEPLINKDCALSFYRALSFFLSVSLYPGHGISWLAQDIKHSMRKSPKANRWPYLGGERFEDLPITPGPDRMLCHWPLCAIFLLFFVVGWYKIPSPQDVPLTPFCPRPFSPCRNPIGNDRYA